VQKTIKGDLAHYQINLSSDDKSQFQLFYHTEKTNKISNVNSPLRWLPLLSRHPDKQAEKMLGKFKLKTGLLAVVFGISNIALIQKLNEQQKIHGGDIIIIEADGLFSQYIYTLFENTLKDTLIINPSNYSYIDDLLERFSIENFLGYRFFQNHTALKLNSTFYKDFEYRIKKILSSKISDFFTRIEFESLWIKNSLQNALLFNRASNVKNLFNTIKPSDQQKEENHKPVLLISTGPSLRKLLPAIKKRQDEFFIVCADSAYRVLHRYNIKVHLIFTLDSQAFTLRHFLGLPSGSKDNFPFLYADLSSNPQVTKRWMGPLILGITAQYLGDKRVVTPGSDYVEEQFLNANDLKSDNTMKTLGDIQSGGSVATSIFDFLRLAGFKEVILAGQDLAYSNREIHTIGTHHSDIWLSKNTSRLNTIENINEAVLRKRHYTYETSISGKKIPADYVLSLYLHWFEEAFEKVDMTIYNAGKEGMIIRNTKRINLSEETSIRQSQESINEVKQIEAKWLKIIQDKILVNNEAIKTFIQSIKKLDWKTKKNQSLILDYFSFMNYIGRKYKVIQNRKIYDKGLDINIEENKEKREEIIAFFQKKQKEQQKIFWEKLQRI